MNELTNGTTAARIDMSMVIEFIWQEADLLDARDYKSWLKLWTKAGYYVIPVDPQATDFASSLNVVYDDAAMREARATRLQGGLSISSSAGARTVRCVSRFRMLNHDAQCCEVRCAQHIAEYKRDRLRILAADITYRLTFSTDGLALDQKVVRLINGDAALHGIGYLL
jgi:3-phenylpropionate/cinnamic acid dioxygenase small subunit